MTGCVKIDIFKNKIYEIKIVVNRQGLVYNVFYITELWIEYLKT